MKITKIFNVESAHIVRNCSSYRCSHSIHGHSAKIEVELEATYLDNAQMVYDFGLMKGTIKELVDSMDHCYLLCKHDSEDFKQFIKSSCDRWIELPFNPSAEMLSLFVLHYVNKIINLTSTCNGEDYLNLACSSVTYWETATGRATCTRDDENVLWNHDVDYDWEHDIVFSEGVRRDWSYNLETIIDRGLAIMNPVIDKQIEL